MLELLKEQPKWFEFAILIHSSDIVVPKSHEILGLINFHKLERTLKVAFQALE